ncbi:outer membrane protein assembly factor BamB [Brackiella oedipodis]|uniref:outer membrane protein assembly factor BamB n=1 Tax=Brackiella oedipodis TaxID=124225 RepID=UPI00048F5441|nr:outer membrane protein assembly factor BamB [Brackiella oedipodis]
MNFKKIKLAAAVALTSVSLAACSIFENPDSFEPVDLTDYTFKVQPNIIWQANIGSEAGPGFSPAVQDNSIYAATPSGDVTKLDLSSGKIIWHTKLEQTLAAGVGTDGNIATVTTRDGQLIALNAADGKELWHTKVSTITSTPPVVGQGKVVVRADDYRVQAFDAQNGELQWSYLRTNAPMALKGSIRLMMTQGAVMASVPIGKAVALNINNGQLIWELSVAPIQGVTDLDVVTDVVGLPVSTNGIVCLDTYQGHVACYTPSKAGQAPALLWNKDFSSSVGLEAHDNLIYGASMHGELTAFSAQNGDMQWQDNTLYNRALTNPVWFNNTLAVGDYEGYVHFYNPQTGEILGRIEAGSSDPIQSPLTQTAAGLLVQTGNGKLVMLGVQ